MYFGIETAKATLAALNKADGIPLADLGESGCVPIPKGRRDHCLVEVPCVVISLLNLLCLAAILPLTFAGVFPSRWMQLLLLTGLAIALLLRRIKSLALKLYLSSRPDGFLKLFSHLPTQPVGLEDGQSHKKTKLVIEDEGVCLLDSDRQRLLIEGCSYRYVIYARDIYSIEPVSGYAMSGARLNGRMTGRNFDVVLMSRGHGPIASLVQSFSPSTHATNLASTLNRTLFGSQTPTYRQKALPPALPTGH